MRTAAVRVVLAAALALTAPQSSPAAEPVPPGERFRAAFAADYTVVVDRTSAAASSPAGLSVRSDSYAFTSRSAAIGAEGKTYRRFRLRILEFADGSAAAAALRLLAGELTGDPFVKWPLLAFTSGSTLYRLDGACLYAPEAWRTIEERLLELFTPVSQGSPSPRLRIACGGNVLESPAPAVQP